MTSPLFFSDNNWQEQSQRVHLWLESHRDPSLSNLRAITGLLSYLQSHPVIRITRAIHQDVLIQWIELATRALKRMTTLDELAATAEFMPDDQDCFVGLVTAWAKLARTPLDFSWGYNFLRLADKRYNRHNPEIQHWDGGRQEWLRSPVPALGIWDREAGWPLATGWGRQCYSQEEISAYYFTMVRYDFRDQHLDGVDDFDPWGFPRTRLALLCWLKLSPTKLQTEEIKILLRVLQRRKSRIGAALHLGDFEYYLRLKPPPIS